MGNQREKWWMLHFWKCWLERALSMLTQGPSRNGQFLRFLPTQTILWLSEGSQMVNYFLSEMLESAGVFFAITYPHFQNKELIPSPPNYGNWPKMVNTESVSLFIFFSAWWLLCWDSLKGSTFSPAARVPAVSWEVIAAVSVFQATDSVEMRTVTPCHLFHPHTG